MHLVKAKLIKHTTADELASFLDNIPLGKEYVIDLDTKREATLWNTEKQKEHIKTLVNEAETGLWMFFELLEIESIPNGKRKTQKRKT